MTSHAYALGMARKAAGGTPATVALSALGVIYPVHSYRHDPSADSYGLEAAEALGIDPDRVLKTLVTDVDGELVVAVVPVSGQLDLKALASAVGGKRGFEIELSPADLVEVTQAVTAAIAR